MCPLRAALALGIGGLAILPMTGSLLAVIFGHQAHRDIKRAGMTGGDGATAAVVTGLVGLGIWSVTFLSGVLMALLWRGFRHEVMTSVL